MGKIIHEGLVPDTDPIYKRGWTILTGRNLNSDYAKSIQEIERARKAEPETGTQTGQVRAMPGGGVIQQLSAISS